MVAPAVVALIAAAVSAAAKGASDYHASSTGKKAARRKSKEIKRETNAGLLQDTLQRGSESEATQLNSKKKLGQRRAQSMNDTADIIRGALKT